MKDRYEYPLAVIAIFRDEARYLKEWIEFHRLVGVEYFYLFNNLSKDHFTEVLNPYIEKGIVKLSHWPIEHDIEEDWCVTQCLAYERALHFMRGKVKWVAMIDTDEFLFPVKKKNLLEVLQDFESFGGVAVNWQIFGSSHVPQILDGELLIDALNLKVPQNENVNKTVKSIVRPERVLGCHTAHHMRYRPGYFHVNTDQIPFRGYRSPYVEISQLRINHYRARDEEFLYTKKFHRILKWWNSHPQKKWEDLYHSFNKTEDREIHRFVPVLKKRLQKSS